MKKMRLNFAAITLTAIILSSCGGISKMETDYGEVNYTVTPDPLEMHGEKVDVKVKVEFPEKYFNKKAILTVTPYLKYGEETAEMESFTLQGESVTANNKVIPFDGGEHEFTGSVDYEEEMMDADLMVKTKIALEGKEEDALDLPGVKIADGVIASADLVRKEPKVVALGDNFQRVVVEQEKADIHYLIQRWNVRSSELREDDVKQLEEFLKESTDKDNINLKNLEIDAYASPDGPIDLNEKVSEGRESSSHSYLKNKVKKYGFEKGTKEDIYNLKSVTEDWEGFKKLVSESDIEDKELILRVLSMHSDPEVREKEIRNMASVFEVLKDDILPELRRSELKVNVEVTGYSDEELKDLATSDPEKLNEEELLYAASLTEDLNKRLEIFQACFNKFPDSYRAINNVGYVYYQMDKLTEAKEAFQKAKELNEDDAIVNNLGAVALKEGNVEEAEEMFTSAVAIGDVANYNLGTVKLINGEYESAVDYFGNSCSANAGLARILQGNYDEALKNLECVKEPDALTHYVKAVVGARTDNESLLISNLRTAVQEEPEFKTRAKKDLEFKKYFTNEAFKGIVE
ncbi:MAG: tetratricopeptide repeat protein [Bacteroidota bacterium]